MKKMKWLGATGAVLALGAVGLVSTTSANAAAPVITASAGSRVTCDLTGTAKLSPTLANPWTASAHSSDPGDAPLPGPATTTGNATIKAAMASIPNDETWVANGGADTPVTNTAKVAATCTGTITDGTNTDTTGLAASISTSSVSAGTDPATCTGLASPGTATYQTIIKWAGTPDKITPSTVTATLGVLTDSHGVGFQLTSGPSDVAGSFASSGSHSVSDAYVDTNTILAIAGGPSTTAGETISPCEATVSEKFTPAATGASDAVAIKLKKPKGLKSIGITTASGDATPSNLCVQSTGTASCPT